MVVVFYSPGCIFYFSPGNSAVEKRNLREEKSLKCYVLNYSNSHNSK